LRLCIAHAHDAQWRPTPNADHLIGFTPVADSGSMVNTGLNTLGPALEDFRAMLIQHGKGR
jgi:hypothetical protein